MDPLNTEFKRLFELSGWNQSEAARQLELSSGAVNQYLSETTRPSLTTLKLFKILLRDTSPLPGSDETVDEADASASELQQWERDFLDSINGLQGSARFEVLELFKSFIKTFLRYTRNPADQSGYTGRHFALNESNSKKTSLTGRAAAKAVQEFQGKKKKA